MFDYNLDVGTKIRSLRKKQKLSLEELSRRCGVTATNLSSIELNKSSPTLATLVKIASAFGKQVNFFLEEILFNDSIHLSKDERRILREIKGAFYCEPLTKPINGQQLRPLLYGLDYTDDEEWSEELVNIGDSFIYILEGAIEVLINNETKYRISRGDTLYIMPEQSFCWRNCGARRTKFILVHCLS